MPFMNSEASTADKQSPAAQSTPPLMAAQDVPKVLHGASSIGKTIFAKWLFDGAREVFDDNCSSCSGPDLRNFNPLQHSVILFDQTSWRSSGGGTQRG